MTTSSTQTMAPPVANTETTTDSVQATLSPRSRIARLILVYHFALIGISCVFYIARGFLPEQFTSLMGILAPVTALYGGAVFRFLGRSITEPNLNTQNNAPINSLVKWLVHGHFIIVLSLISLTALAPNILTFQDLIMFLTLVESALGVYMGNIILALFEGKTEK
jgi:hypothetical protein